MVCEGTIEKKGFFDRINPGDTVFYDRGETQTKEHPTLPGIPDRPLYKKILSIR
jgi:hypothetical protein